MAEIKITHGYSMRREQLISQLDKLAVEMHSRYQLDCSWKSDSCLAFKRSGASGEVIITDKELLLTIKMGMLLGAFKSTIEQDIKKFLHENVK
ncbi:MAG: polyhydroxyalkanoic acid system family protein [Spongiibacteraceae bacterium]